MALAKKIRDIRHMVLDNVCGKWEVSVVISWCGFFQTGKPVWQADIQYYNDKEDKPEYACNFAYNGEYYDAFGQGETPEEAISNLHSHLCNVFGAVKANHAEYVGEDRDEWLNFARLY
jgi:hypothetical protein